MMPERCTFGHRLAGKVAIITGAGSAEEGTGIGDAIAQAFARQGAAVAVVDIDGDRARRTVSRINGEGGIAMAIVGDVSDAEACARIASSALSRYSRINCLVNNVGVSAGGGLLEDLVDAEWDRVLSLNLKSAVLMSKHVIPHIIGGGGGALINIASISGLRAHGGVAYGPSKAAMIALTRELAVLYGPAGLRCNALAPGHIHTPFVASRVTAQERLLRRTAAPANIEGDAWDVAAAAVFLASEEARFIAGVCLPIDGGVSQVGALTAIKSVLASQQS